ncbi:MAG: hypothetical protein ABI833_03440 [Acidobacteriota bacterium]
MPKKKISAEKQDEGVLISAAKAIGAAAGKIARLAGAAPAAQKGKLQKKNKTKLPRRQKKAAQKKREMSRPK